MQLSLISLGKSGVRWQFGKPFALSKSGCVCLRQKVCLKTNFNISNVFSKTGNVTKLVWRVRVLHGLLKRAS